MNLADTCPVDGWRTVTVTDCPAGVSTEEEFASAAFEYEVRRDVHGADVLSRTTLAASLVGLAETFNREALRPFFGILACVVSFLIDGRRIGRICPRCTPSPVAAAEA